MKMPWIAVCCAAWMATPAWAAKPHDHAVARLDVAVDPARLSLALEVPQEALVGFERAPRTEAERAKAQAALATLRDGARLFRIDAAAGCTLAKAEVEAPLLQAGADAASTAATTASKDGGHADIDAHYEFECKSGAKAGSVEVTLFEAFPALKRIELQVVTPKGQMKATLARPASRVMLVR